MKKVLTILTVVVAGGVALVFFLNRGSGAKPLNNASSQEEVPVIGAESSVKDLNPDMPKDPYFYIATPSGSVPVKNFYLNDPPVEEADIIRIKSGDGYSILYGIGDSVFWISYSKPMSRDLRLSAGKDLLATLGIAAGDACRLTVWETQSGSSSRVPLGFCGSIK